MGAQLGGRPAGRGRGRTATSAARSARPATSSARTGEADAVAALLSTSQTLAALTSQAVSGTGTEVTAVQMRTLTTIAQAGAAPAGVLAATLGVHPSTFTRTIDRLQGYGWVQRGANPANRREVLVSLTPEGKKVLSSVTRRQRQAVSRALNRLSAGEQDQLIDSLQLLERASTEAMTSGRRRRSS